MNILVAGGAGYIGSHMCKYLAENNYTPVVLDNLGNGDGKSVKQVIETARKITGEKIPLTFAERRPGDPAVLIVSSEKAFKELDWKPQFADLMSILETAWKWHKKNPDVFGA